MRMRMASFAWLETTVLASKYGNLALEFYQPVDVLAKHGEYT